MREDGYYWIKFSDNWIIGRWVHNGGRHGGVFYINGNPYYENQINKVDESVITR
jgi:hypothetical protein